MRILHIYGGNLYGGVERLLATLARHCQAAPGLEQRFALCFRARLWRELEACGTPVHDLGRVRVRYPWQVRRARQRLRAWLKQEPVDAVLCHAWWSYAIFGPACRRAGIPVGLWVHDCATGRGWLERWAARRRPDFALTWGPYMAASLRRLYPGIEARLWTPPQALPPTLSEDQRRTLRRSLDTGDDAVVILQASRMERWKGQALLLEALATLESSADWVVWMAGGAQRPQERRYAGELRRQAARLGLEARIRWLGERHDVAALMAAADIFCQPNTRPEPFGVVFQEAMAAGLPVVATVGGGASEQITADCGVLMAAEPAAVEAALGALIAEPARRRALGAAGRARAAQRSEVAAGLEALATTIAEALA